MIILIDSYPLSWVNANKINLEKSISSNMKFCLYILFTFSQLITTSSAQTPGGVSTNLEFWLKADAGTTGFPTVTAWADQSTVNNDATAAGNPQLVTSGLNYNPTVVFDGTGDYFSAPADIQSNFNGVFVVIKAGITGVQAEGFFTIMDNLSTYDGANIESGALLLRTGTGSNLKARIDNVNILTNTGALDGNFHIHSVTMNATDMFMHQNSYQETTNTYTASLSSEKYYIASRYYNSTPAKFLNGEIAEVIHYNMYPSSTNRNQIESYLAIKYGITLANTGGGTQGDYTATTGANIWDADINASCHNNVIGIGRENSEGLYQKQSHTPDDTTRIYLGSLAATNGANTGTIGNFSYIMIGDNQGAMNANATANAEVPGTCGLYSRLEREWKVTRTSAGTDFSIDVTLNSGAGLGSVTVSQLRLLVDDDGDFSNGGTTCYFNGDIFGTVISYSNPIITVSGISSTHITNNSTRYITIGSTNIQTPLPVELISFDATCQSNKVPLTWSTTTEINNDYFTIERSSDAVHFKPIGIVNGNGNSFTTINYNWADDNPINKTAYYRLKQTNFDGFFEYIGVRSTSCKQLNDIGIYPNPFENSFTVQLPENTFYPATVEVIDYLGRIIYNATIETKTTVITLDNLPTGTFFVKIFNETVQFIELMVKMN